MLKLLAGTFFGGIAIGIMILPIWALVWFYQGFWWGAVAVLVVLGLALKLVFMPTANRLARRVVEAIELVRWAGAHWIEHIDPTSLGGTYRGTALSLIIAYRRHWSLDEQIDLLRDLKTMGHGRGRNPDDDRLFTVFLKDSPPSAVEHEKDDL